LLKCGLGPLLPAPCRCLLLVSTDKNRLAQPSTEQKRCWREARGWVRRSDRKLQCNQSIRWRLHPPARRTIASFKSLHLCVWAATLMPMPACWWCGCTVVDAASGVGSGLLNVMLVALQSEKFPDVDRLSLSACKLPPKKNPPRHPSPFVSIDRYPCRSRCHPSVSMVPRWMVDRYRYGPILYGDLDVVVGEDQSSVAGSKFGAHVELISIR
jgi:hypothetical protein